MKDNKRPQLVHKDYWNLVFKWWRKECHKNGCSDNIDEFHYGADGYLYRGKKLVNCKLRGNQKSLPCEQYKQMLLNRGIIFQSETSSMAYFLLKKYPSIASAIAKRFPIIIIDECQDISEEQMAVFDILFNAGMKSAFLIGDPDQSIYEWRNATPKRFIEKMAEKEWVTNYLTGNFRCSQNICNAVKGFSFQLLEKQPNQALGNTKDELQKPVLLLTTDGIDSEIIYQFFGKKCAEMNITSPEKIAVLSRGRINSVTSINGLWKSKEIEIYAEASYEWKHGSRRKAYRMCSQATYSLVFGSIEDVYIMEKRIIELVDELAWKKLVIDILRNSPDINLEIAVWVKIFQEKVENLIGQSNMNFHDSKSSSQIFKIKSRDQKNPEFNKLPLKEFIEKKSIESYTRSSVHGVKGETYDAILLHVNARKGQTLTPKFLNDGDLDSELMRIAYVAMTRPRRLLVVAIPIDDKIFEYKRFPKALWDYEFLN